MKTLYKWWAGLMLVAVILQIGFAGYGAFYVAGRVDGDGKTVDQDSFENGFGIHMGFGYIVVLLGLVFLVIGLIAGIGRWRLGRHGVVFGLLILQVLLAWFGSGTPAIGFFHPVNAMFILVILVWIVRDFWRTDPQPVTSVTPA